MIKPLLTSSLLGLAIFSSVHAHEGHKHAPKAKAMTEVVRTGNGSFTYENVLDWGKLPDDAKLGPTHGGVAVDKQGLIYVSTNNEMSICVFKPDGTFVKAMTPEARAIHGLQIVEEDGKEYLYGAQLGGKGKTRALKIDLEGNILMEIPNKNTGEIQGGFKGITGIAVAPDGSVFASMGYGSNFIHKFDKEGKLIKTFGGPGKELEKFNTCHGLAIDTRFGEPRLLVCDRAKRRLVHLDLDGKWIGVHASNLRLPCAVSFFGDYLAVAELQARVVIIDKTGTPVSFIGDNPNKKQWANFKVANEDQNPGIFSAPHGLSFDATGNLYVQDWNATGRVSKLTLVK